ncbi:MAG TPA: NAD(P)-binding domain-containing protein [Blastocatellia bacterium]|jgi:thioredoxin reductase (NADPH)
MYDLVIVGSGPSGLAAALAAKRRGLIYIALERGVLADTIYHYPRAKPLFSSSEEVELETDALPRDQKPTREQVLEHYNEVAARGGLNIKAGEEVLRITRSGEGFTVETDKDEYRSRTVLVAVGGFGRQRRLNVPGEDSSLVSYRFSEAEPFAGKRVLVVGGGNSAAEAALFLAEVGASVTLSIRRSALDAEDEVDEKKIGAPRARIKPWVMEPLGRAISEGSIRLITRSEVAEIRPRSALLCAQQGAESDPVEVECDHIFALIGADPDTRLLEEAGALIAEDGRPVYDPSTYETTVEGIYVAGHVTRELHMKNALAIAKRVAERIASQVVEKVSRLENADCRA